MDGQVEYPGVQGNVGQTLSCPNEKDCEPSQDLSKQIRVCVWGVSHVSHDLSRATQKLILTGRRENPDQHETLQEVPQLKLDILTWFTPI